MSDGAHRKEQSRERLLTHQTVRVVRRRVRADIVGRPLVMVALESPKDSFLLVITVDSWVLTGAFESQSFSLEQMRALEIVRCYSPGTKSLWDKVDLDITAGILHVRD